MIGYISQLILIFFFGSRFLHFENLKDLLTFASVFSGSELKT